MQFKKILIIGHGRHGKDTVAKILRDEFGYTFKSSSELAAEIFIYDLLKSKYGYSTFQECYNDRHNHRAEWYDLIKEYNKDDRARLAKEILRQTDCYVGMREREEILECLNQNLFDLIIWVDRFDFEPPEPEDSFNIEKNLADILIDNNYFLEDLKRKVIRLGKLLCVT